LPIRDVRQKTMQGDTQIRVHKIGKNSVIGRSCLEPVAWNALLNDAMELRMVTIEILGVTVYSRPLGQWRKVWVICATLSL